MGINHTNLGMIIISSAQIVVRQEQGKKTDGARTEDVESGADANTNQPQTDQDQYRLKALLRFFLQLMRTHVPTIDAATANAATIPNFLTKKIEIPTI